ncbi:hypothetical protein HDU91_001653 [Kappamyces sp. JEL0680]|nr:hypothetical protein HDU91_001653 [Kappamyces sp. JEL0680]
MSYSGESNSNVFIIFPLLMFGMIIGFSCIRCCIAARSDQLLEEESADLQKTNEELLQLQLMNPTSQASYQNIPVLYINGVVPVGSYPATNVQLTANQQAYPNLAQPVPAYTASAFPQQYSTIAEARTAPNLQYQ